MKHDKTHNTLKKTLSGKTEADGEVKEGGGGINGKEEAGTGERRRRRWRRGWRGWEVDIQEEEKKEEVQETGMEKEGEGRSGSGKEIRKRKKGAKGG